ncbi:hypothetical protein [Clostridium hydrogeniformans]|uniref:hypothetical protein n=1 Tax=Clostridium hydrogeniformans TaxID=349933 RepID=UPI00047FC2C7|nr:hypothetical protein [Clostridium hydrogeniformans]
MKNTFLNLIHHLFIVNFIYYGHIILISLLKVNSKALPVIELLVAIALYTTFSYCFLKYEKNTKKKVITFSLIPIISLVFFLITLIAFRPGINSLSSDAVWTPFLIFNGFILPLIETSNIGNILIGIVIAFIPAVCSFIGMELQCLKKIKNTVSK